MLFEAMNNHAALVLALVVATIPTAFAQLNSYAKLSGRYFGTATDNPELVNTTYVNILKNSSEFGQVTPGNALKWYEIEPEQGVFSYTNGDQIVNMTVADGQILRCHTLVWHSGDPSWVTNGKWTVKTLTAVLQNHIKNVVTYYKGKCYSWDVVNEALNDDGTYRNSTFYNLLGPSYIKIAFAAAAAADPKAKLYYNDYNIESPGTKATSAQTRIVKYLKDAGIRIDGVGLQSHFISGGTPSQNDQIANMKTFVGMGLEVAVTELDIRIQEPVTTQNLAQQSLDYVATVGACMQVKGCVGVTVWDFYDPFSWVPSTFAGYGSADLWFPDFTKHPAYQALINVMKVTKTTSRDLGGGSRR